MHKPLAALSLCFFASGCVVALGNSGAVADALDAYEAEKELHGVVKDFNEAYESGEIRAVFLESIAESDSVIVIGSLAEEWTVGIEAMREAMSAGGGEVKYIGRDLHSSELQMSEGRGVGWLVEHADLHYEVAGEKKSLMGFRATSVWERVEGVWKIVHFHGSMPDAVNEI